MDLSLTEGQAAALAMVGGFLESETEHVAVLTGPAGSGKTTIIKVIKEVHGEPIVLTPTGKAALRVREATGIHATTIHSFLYKPEDDARTGEPIFILKSLWDIGDAVRGRLVLIDEASMLDDKVWQDLVTMARLASYKILLMGDRFQLPPVKKTADGQVFCSLDVPTPFSINLTEVVRQALDSPIIRASILLRTGRPIHEATALLSPVAPSKLIETLLAFHEKGGATLCHRNITRNTLNQKARQALSYQPGDIVEGEPLLVLQNNDRVGRCNGEIVNFLGWETPPSDGTQVAVRDNYSNSSLNMSFGVANLEGSSCVLSPEEVSGRSEEAKIGVWTIRKASRRVYLNEMARYGEEQALPHVHANYGYALTCHKSQGSEFPEVLIIMEPSLNAMPMLEQKRFLYTAITRAQKKTSYVSLPAGFIPDR